MTAGRASRRGQPRRSAVLGGEAGVATAGDLVNFAETLVTEAQPETPFRVMGISLNLIGTATARVTGEALCLGGVPCPVWRVTLTDEGGVLVAEVTLTLATQADIEPETPTPAVAVAVTPDDRRARIAEAACNVFAEKGYAAATMREVAAAAGMHVPTMYQYFRSKEEILELVYSWTINRAIAAMEPALSATGPAGPRMRNIVRALHDMNHELRRETGVINRETRALSRAARDRVLGRYAGMVRQIADVIEAGQQEGVFRPLDAGLAANFVDALADVWPLRPFAVGSTDSAIYAAELVDFVWGALVAPLTNDHKTNQQESVE